MIILLRRKFFYVNVADKLLILGCDGLWDVIEPDDAYGVAKKAGRARDGRWDLQAAAHALVVAALERKTGDNVSVLLLGLKKPRRSPGAAGKPSAAKRPSAAKLQVTLAPGGMIQKVTMQE